jgi:hypothetical protein
MKVYGDIQSKNTRCFVVHNIILSNATIKNQKQKNYTNNFVVVLPLSLCNCYGSIIIFSTSFWVSFANVLHEKELIEMFTVKSPYSLGVFLSICMCKKSGYFTHLLITNWQVCTPPFQTYITRSVYLVFVWFGLVLVSVCAWYIVSLLSKQWAHNTAEDCLSTCVFFFHACVCVCHQCRRKSLSWADATLKKWQSQH